MNDQANLFNVADECYDCGCDLKPACADREGKKMRVRVQRVHENAKMPVRAHKTAADRDWETLNKFA